MTPVQPAAPSNEAREAMLRRSASPHEVELARHRLRELGTVCYRVWLDGYYAGHADGSGIKVSRPNIPDSLQKRIKRAAKRRKPLPGRLGLRR